MSLDSHPSLRTLWPLSNHQTFLQEVKLCQCVFCEENFDNLVPKHSSQSRSSEKCDSVATFVGYSGSDSRELCADACNSVSFRFSLNLSNHSGRSASGSSELILPLLFIWDLDYWRWHQSPGCLVRHFALTQKLKMNLKQVAPIPWLLFQPLCPVKAMLETNCFQGWRTPQERRGAKLSVLQ